MSKKFQAVRGMNDMLPADAHYWHRLESTLARVVQAYGYQEIRFPMVESTALYNRSLGDGSDIVSKEMYTFDDRNGDSLTLRPEGTASCVRACIEHGLLYNQTQRLWYLGPMFRHERPQKGRYRQFYQFGVEAFGFDNVTIDIEQLLMTAALWRELGLSDVIRLQINSLGSSEERAAHRMALIEYFSQHRTSLDEDSLRRLHTNPLRILDSKNPALASIQKGAPKLSDYFNDASTARFKALTDGLNRHGIAYEFNPRLVRGMDYYCQTVFEWVTDALGTQGTVCAGGRYDGLVEEFGGKATAGMGFAFGVERIILLLREYSPTKPLQPCAYLIATSELASQLGLVLAESLRKALPQLTMINAIEPSSLKSQFKRADKSGARFAIILDDEALSQQRYGLKSLGTDEKEKRLTESELTHFLASTTGK